MEEPNFNSSVEQDYDKQVLNSNTDGWGHNLTGGNAPVFNSSVEQDYDKQVLNSSTDGWGNNLTGINEQAFNNSEEMVYNKEGEKIMAGGYSVNSLLLNQGMPVAYSGESTGASTGGKGKTHVSDKVSDRFKNLAIPAGLYLGSNYSNAKNSIDMNEAEVINDDLYEKLLKLAQGDKGSLSNVNIRNEHIYKKKKRITKKKYSKQQKKGKKSKTKRK
jgi:hypothetical protein